MIWIKFHRQGTRLQNSTVALTSQITLKVPAARCAFVADEFRSRQGSVLVDAA